MKKETKAVLFGMGGVLVDSIDAWFYVLTIHLIILDLKN